LRESALQLGLLKRVAYGKNRRLSFVTKQRRTITLVLGGARSGKSSWAQKQAARFSRVTYLATAHGGDSEMRAKIARHRRERPPTWRTVEAATDLPETIRAESKGADVLLIDCFTLYVANVMLTGKKSEDHNSARVRELRDAIRSSSTSIIAVSNEVGSGIVPAFRSGRVYRDMLGRLNQEVAAIADNVILMVAGIPLPVKGRLTSRRRV
jgi:adenosylcobinamide kinase / adenosylcobinamide-phosphate guanylyltransferase